MVCVRAEQYRRRKGSYLLNAAYMVCGRAKQYRRRSGSYLLNAAHMVCGKAKQYRRIIVDISAVQHTCFVGELSNVDLGVVPISAEQAYNVCGSFKQSRLRSGSYLNRASIHGLW